eukprot:jgi/Ulvmu1/11146/UM071_0030.1
MLCRHVQRPATTQRLLQCPAVAGSVCVWPKVWAHSRVNHHPLAMVCKHVALPVTHGEGVPDSSLTEDPVESTAMLLIVATQAMPACLESEHGREQLLLVGLAF